MAHGVSEANAATAAMGDHSLPGGGNGRLNPGPAWTPALQGRRLNPRAGVDAGAPRRLNPGAGADADAPGRGTIPGTARGPGSHAAVARRRGMDRVSLRIACITRSFFYSDLPRLPRWRLFSGAGA